MDAAALRDDAARFLAASGPVGILPPDQYLSLVVRVTEGCSWNACTFCRLYRDIPFRYKSRPELLAHLAALRAYFGPSLALRRSVFLGDANALCLSHDRLLPLVEAVAREFGGAPLFSFLDAWTGQRKTAVEWRDYQGLGLKRVYVGLETGDPALLAWLGKPGVPQDAVDLVGALHEAGIGAGVIVLLGAGGERFAAAHARRTAEVLSAMSLGPLDLVYFSEYVDDPELAYGQKRRRSDRFAAAPARAQRRAAAGDPRLPAPRGPRPSAARRELRPPRVRVLRPFGSPHFLGATPGPVDLQWPINARGGALKRAVVLESVLVVSLFGSGLPGSADEKPSPPVFKAGVDVVNITITVRDKLGQLVSDLTADDFVVYEDGHPQQVALFARATEPGQEDALSLDLGLLLDTSESMAQQMKLTRESALRFLDAIPRARDLLVIFFDQDIRISRYDSENQQGLVERIIDMKGSGNTALYDAITVYLSRVEESPGRKVLVLFTDGEDSRSITTLTELISLVRSSNVMVYAISFAGSSFSLGSNRYVSARTFLAYLAEMTGGDIYTPTIAARPRGDLPEDPECPGRAVRHRLRLGQPEARRQVPQAAHRAQGQGPRSQDPAPRRVRSGHPQVAAGRLQTIKARPAPSVPRGVRPR